LQRTIDCENRNILWLFASRAADRMQQYGCSVVFVVEGAYLVKPISNPRG